MSQLLTISHVDRLNKNTNDYFLLVGEGDTGLPSWYIIKSTERQMSSVRHDEPINLTAFGTIVKSGFGFNPPAHIFKEYAQS